jgi:MFS family permease
MGSAFFFGLFMFLPIIPPLGDIYGRKIVFKYTMYTTLAAQFFMVFSKSFEITVACIFVSGACWNGKNIVGLSYAEEFLPKKHSKDIIAALFIIGSVAMFYAPLQFITFSNSWFSLGGVMIVTTFMCIAVMTEVPESPKFLYEHGRYDEARLSLFTVARFNRVTIKQNIIFDKESPEFK